jgi:pyrimidine operon attenuation protein/uracil phosphoribosyltransferase
MKLTINTRGSDLTSRLRERLEKVEALRCETHQAPLQALDITTFENGWFDSHLSGCCDELVQQATRIVGSRC